MAGPVRLNRYLAAAGLGTRREVEGLIRVGRVTLDGAAVEDPTVKVAHGQTVLVDGEVLGAGPTGAVLHRTPGTPLSIVHPGRLHPVLALPASGGGLELLLADPRLARRLSDNRHPLKQRVDRDGIRSRLAGFDLEGLAPGAWRPIAPRELEKLRLSARLPPRAG
ncbi:MAG: S4 domain-containing protein [Gaiellales bacterium]